MTLRFSDLSGSGHLFVGGTNFRRLHADVAGALLDQEPFNAGKWQAVDVSDSQAHDTYELMNTTLWLDIPENQHELENMIEPDMPWSEGHFQERVAGKPVNPGDWHHRWPYHANGAELHIDERPKTVSEADWAYLAAMIDADGSISFAKKKYEEVGRPRVQISQKDHDFVHAIQAKYGVGKVSARERDNVIGPDGKIRRSNAATWFLSGKATTLYVLEKIEPYLMLKKDKAQEGIRVLKNLKPHHADVPLKTETERIYDHNYMERFWPKLAGNASQPHQGIRFSYGDLADVVAQLQREPLTRQAFLPIFHPEDTGATAGQRVPCTLGYHFIIRENKLHMVYYLRSCEIYRHFKNDVYMAMRLGQWVRNQVFNLRANRDLSLNAPEMGSLTMHITSLHGFVGDTPHIEAIADLE